MINLKSLFKSPLAMLILATESCVVLFFLSYILSFAFESKLRLTHIHDVYGAKLGRLGRAKSENQLDGAIHGQPSF